MEDNSVIDEEKVNKLLNTLLSKSIKLDDKKEMLRNQFNIDTSIELEGDLNTMCNLSDGVFEEAHELGLKQGIEEGLQQGIEQGEKRLADLIYYMEKYGRLGEVGTVLSNKEVREKLYKEYNIL